MRINSHLPASKSSLCSTYPSISISPPSVPDYTQRPTGNPRRTRPNPAISTFNRNQVNHPANKPLNHRMDQLFTISPKSQVCELRDQIPLSLALCIAPMPDLAPRRQSRGPPIALPLAHSYAEVTVGQKTSGFTDQGLEFSHCRLSNIRPMTLYWIYHVSSTNLEAWLSHATPRVTYTPQSHTPDHLTSAGS